MNNHLNRINNIILMFLLYFPISATFYHERNILKYIALFIAISTACVPLMANDPTSASMDDQSSTARIQVRPSSSEPYLRCCVKACVLPACLAFVCAVDTVACPKRTLLSEPADPFAGTKILWRMYTDSLCGND